MKNNQTVEEYIASHTPDTQKILNKIRKIMSGHLPNATQSISYGIPTFKLDGKPVIYFAGYPKHVSIYPIPTGDASFEKKIKPFVAGRGTLKFLLKDPIPYDLIEEVTKVAVKNRG